MKHAFPKYLSVAVLIAFTFSCNKKNIDLKPSLPTDATYFDTEKQFDQGVVGIYSKLVFFYNYRGYSGNGWLHDVRLLPDDDITTNSLSPFESFVTMTVGNAKSSDYFTYLYQLNARANNMLDIFQKKADKVYENQELKKWNKGEMLFLRGFSHFQLWNLYGVAPVILKRISSDSLLYPGNSTGTQLLDAAIDDFVAAAALLPVKWPDASSLGRLTKGAALAMAGKSFLYRGTVNKNSADFTAALQQFNAINGYSLLTNFGDNFLLSKENNAESVFEVQLGRNSRSEGSNPWLNTDQFDGNGDIGGYWGFYDNHWSLFGISRFVPTQSLRTAFSSTDPRSQTSFNSDGILKYVVGTFGGEDPFQAAYDNNARIIRYSDVLLMKAEAILQSGGSTVEAIQILNQIRARARNTVSPASAFPADRDVNEANKNKIMQWIIEERRLELAFEEGHRWYDLRRWHLGGVLKTVYGKDLESGWDFSSVQTPFKFEKKNLYLPIPFSELQLNKNLQQNELWK